MPRTPAHERNDHEATDQATLGQHVLHRARLLQVPAQLPLHLLPLWRLTTPDMKTASGADTPEAMKARPSRGPEERPADARNPCRLRSQQPPVESPARQAARWADPLTDAERDELAGALARAFARYDFKDWNSYGTYDPARVMAAAECRDLRLDVIGRKGVYR